MDETIGNRLRRARTLAKYSSGSDAARAYGWPVSTYLGHENGDRVPRIDTIRKYARAFRVDPSFIAYGDVEIRPISEDQKFVPIKGFVASGGLIIRENFEFSTGDLIKFEMEVSDNVFALSVMGNNTGPRFQAGDTLIVKAGFSSDAEMLDRYVYVKLANGQEYVRSLRRGAGGKSYDLLPYGDEEPVISSVDIDEFGVIVLIIPGGFYGDLDGSPLVGRISSGPS